MKSILSGLRYSLAISGCYNKSFCLIYLDKGQVKVYFRYPKLFSA